MQVAALTFNKQHFEKNHPVCNCDTLIGINDIYVHGYSYKLLNDYGGTI